MCQCTPNGIICSCTCIYMYLSLFDGLQKIYFLLSTCIFCYVSSAKPKVVVYIVPYLCHVPHDNMCQISLSRCSTLSKFLHGVFDTFSVLGCRFIGGSDSLQDCSRVSGNSGSACNIFPMF